MRMSCGGKGPGVGRVVRAAALAVALILVATTPAAADRKVRVDPDDSTGALDIAEVAHNHNRGLLTHRLTTYERWETSVLEDGLSDIYFDFFVGDRYVYARVDVSPDGTLFGEMRNRDTERIIGFVKVWRPSKRKLRIEFPKRMLGRNVTSYRWSASTSFHRDGHETCGSGPHIIIACIDYAPSRGYIRHSLP